MLRFDERYGHVLKNRAAMLGFCFAHPQGKLANCHEYVFRADTRDYAYIIHCTPDETDKHVYVYPYNRPMLECHMKQAEKGIRFVTPDNREKFRIPDGESIRIIADGGMSYDRMVRYVDYNHFEIGFNDLHDTREFAEWLERIGRKVIPLLSTLPDMCYSIPPSGDEVVIIKKGEEGYYSIGKYGHDCAEAQSIADECNRNCGVSKAQEAAMLSGSMFGWDTPAADPKNYDEKGRLIKPRHSDRGDAR